MAVRDDRSDVKQTTAGFRDPRHHICRKQIPIPSLRSDFLLALTVKHSMSFSLTIRSIFQAMKKILMNTQVRLLRRRKRP